MKSIGLMGLTFVSDNKGCMALAYSFKQIIEKYISTKFEKVYVFSLDNYILDVSNSFTKFELVYISVKKPNTMFGALKKMRKCEFIFDFTEGDSFSDIYGFKRFCKNILIKKMAIDGALKYVLCPQTYGPYSHFIARKLAKHIFEHSYYICSRDQLSADAVKQITGKNIEVYTDVAFGLKKKKIDFNDGNTLKKIGINVSALLWNGGYDSKNQFNLKVDYRKYILELIKALIASERYCIHLLPHVYNESMYGIENDYAVCKKIQEQYPDCIVAPCYKLPSEIKSYISHMDCFIGARMHSTIAAFSAGVPTIPFSYSRKFEGLYGSIEYRCGINAREESTKEALKDTLAYIDNSDELLNDQYISLNIVKERLNAFEYKVSQILSGE